MRFVSPFSPPSPRGVRAKYKKNHLKARELFLWTNGLRAFIGLCNKDFDWFRFRLDVLLGGVWLVGYIFGGYFVTRGLIGLFVLRDAMVEFVLELTNRGVLYSWSLYLP